MDIENHIHCSCCGRPLPEIEESFSYWGYPPKCNFCLKKHPKVAASACLNKRILEGLVNKTVKIVLGEIGHTVTGKLIDFDDLLIFVTEGKGKKVRRIYYPIYNIIVIEEVVKEIKYE